MTSYLRYAFLQPKLKGGGDTLSPVAWITLRKGDAIEQGVQLFAFDKSLSTADTSLMTFRWVETDEELGALQNSLMPKLFAVIGGKEFALTIANTPDFQSIGRYGLFI